MTIVFLIVILERGGNFMSYINISFTSTCCHKEQEIVLIMPQNPVKTIMVLLHGLGGNAHTIPTKLNLQRLSDQYNCAFICPNGDRSFYTYLIDGRDYYSYLHEEMWEYLTPFFDQDLHTYHKFIGGISMGGYGAWLQTLFSDDFYEGLILISPSLDIVDRDRIKRRDPELCEEWCAMFGPKLDVKHDLFRFPINHHCQYYIACGNEDYLLSASKKFVQHLTTNKISYHFETGKGSHNKDFFYHYLKRGIKYMLNDI